MKNHSFRVILPILSMLTLSSCAGLGPHQYASTWSHDNNNHWHACTDRGYEGLKQDEAPHTYTDAVVAPTFDTEGYTSHTCTVCGYSYNDNKTSKLEHNYETTWSKDDRYHWHACTDTGFENLKTDYAPHGNYTDVETPATDTEEGYITHTCVCGYSYVTEVPYVNDQGLLFQLQDDGTYAVSIGNATRLTRIRIPSKYNGRTVTTIAANGFYHHETLTFVSLPSTITTIENSAFEGCYLLDNVTIPSGVTYLGQAAFCACRALSTVTVPAGVKNLYLNAFNSCLSLTSISLPEGLLTIGESAFDSCLALTEINIPSTVTSIGKHAFWRDSKLEVIRLFDGVQTVGEEACGYCSKLEYIDVTVNNMINFANMEGKEYMFRTYETFKAIRLFDANGQEITDVVVPSGITSIKDRAFYGCCNVTSISLPTTVTSIGDYAFYGCDLLTSFVVPEGVTEIGYDFLVGCTKVTTLSLPSTLNTIGESFLFGCYSLETITLASTNATFKMVDGIIYTKDGKTLVRCTPKKQGAANVLDGVTTIKDNAFNFCRYLTSITLPNTVQTIHYAAFYHCYGLTSINIPEGVTRIEEYTFTTCIALTVLVLPRTITRYGEYAFAGCSALEMICLPFEPGITSRYSNLFESCEKLTRVCVYSTNPSAWVDESVYRSAHSGNIQVIMTYYSENEPDGNSNYEFWHFVDGTPTVWPKN